MRTVCKGHHYLCKDILLVKTGMQLVKPLLTVTSSEHHLFYPSKSFPLRLTPLQQPSCRMTFTGQKKQEYVNLNMAETSDSVAETQRQTCVSVSGYITVYITLRLQRKRTTFLHVSVGTREKK